MEAMDAEDDMIVLVVADEDERAKVMENVLSAKMFLEDTIETLEPAEEDEYQNDYLDGINEVYIKEEPKMGDEEDILPDDADYIPGDEEYLQLNDEDSSPHKIRRFTMLKPAQQHSFVEELRQQFEDLRDDEDLLIYTLKKIMKQIKPPPPPQDYYIMNGINFECVFCEFLSESMPAASRHYQERHGQRYLVCYACGVDFRSTTNLYKHEKRCIAPDADIVLRARAAFLGRKGRSRPYLPRKNSKKRKKFPCSLCSAVFITKNNLNSHENLHRGERPYRCHVCPCAYTSYSALSRHAKKHTDIQFICDHCNRSFKIKAALVAHMDTHKPIRKYGCSECNRRFAQKSALMLHVNKIHRNLPPPCACQICPKRYARMSLLKAHMKKAHGLSIITRKMFYKTLPTMTDLEIIQSKIVLKNDEEDLLDFTRMVQTAPVNEPFCIKLEPEQSEKFEEGYPKDSNKRNEPKETSQEMSMDEFMQYVEQDDQDTSSKV